MNSPEAKRYRKLKVAELRELLESRGQDGKGLKKEELIQKCMETEELHTGSAEETTGSNISEGEAKMPLHEESADEADANTSGDPPAIASSVEPSVLTDDSATPSAAEVTSSVDNTDQQVINSQGATVDDSQKAADIVTHSSKTNNLTETDEVEVREAGESVTGEMDTGNETIVAGVEGQVPTEPTVSTGESTGEEQCKESAGASTSEGRHQEPMVTSSKPENQQMTANAEDLSPVNEPTNVESTEGVKPANTGEDRFSDQLEAAVAMDYDSRRERIGPHTPDADEPMEEEEEEERSATPAAPDAPAESGGGEPATGGVFSLLSDEPKEPAVTSAPLVTETAVPIPKGKKEWKYDAEPVVMENADWVERETVELDRYHCDLNMFIDEAGMSCKPLSRGGFGYMWAGARANYGVSSPCSIAFQLKVTGRLPINIKDQPLGENYMARVGWSISSTDHQLGESPYSFGYQSTGRCCCDSLFVDYGESYDVGDVITSYLDITDTMVTISFSKNDGPVVEAYKLESHLLGLDSLYPHISTKNFSMAVNFGQLEKPWYAINENYCFISELPLDGRDRAVKPVTRKSECSVYLMVGLVGAGKSHWVANTLLTSPEKRWNVLGTPELLGKMKVDGVEISKCYSGRWDDLYDKTNSCLKKLISIAATRLRNYIIDQTNVYEGAQCRKVRPFKGFTRKAIVVIPSDDDYLKRLEERNKATNKSINNDAILEMKANFTIPVAGAKPGREHSFHEVLFADLNKEDATKLVTQYNAEGQVKFKKISKQYHKREKKAAQRKVDLAKMAARKAQREARKQNAGRKRKFSENTSLPGASNYQVAYGDGMVGVNGMGGNMGGNRRQAGGMGGDVNQGGMMQRNMDGGMSTMMGQGMMGQSNMGNMNMGQMNMGNMNMGQMNMGQMNMNRNNIGPMGMGPNSMGQMNMGANNMNMMNQGNMNQMGQMGMGQNNMGQMGMNQGNMGSAMNQTQQGWSGMQNNMAPNMLQSMMQEAFQQGVNASGAGFNQSGGNWNNLQNQQIGMPFNQQGNNMMGGGGTYQQQYNQGYNQNFGGGY